MRKHLLRGGMEPHGCRVGRDAQLPRMPGGRDTRMPGERYTASSDLVTWVRQRARMLVEMRGRGRERHTVGGRVAGESQKQTQKETEAPGGRLQGRREGGQYPSLLLLLLLLLSPGGRLQGRREGGQYPSLLLLLLLSPGLWPALLPPCSAPPSSAGGPPLAPSPCPHPLPGTTAEGVMGVCGGGGKEAGCVVACGGASQPPHRGIVQQDFDP